MHETLIIADASPLIALVDIEELEVLHRLYERVIVTDIVRGEIHAELPGWIEVATNYNQNQLQILSLELDKGEASTIAFAMEHPQAKILMDEKKGRTAAKRLGLTVTGTVGVLLKAKEQGLITSGKDILEKLEKHGFWLSEELRALIAGK